MDFEKIQKALESSPEEIKDLLFSTEVGSALDKISQDSALDEEMTTKLVDEVGLIILGLKERSTLKESLPSIGIPKDTVLQIIQVINKEIFERLDKIKMPPEVKTEIPPTSVAVSMPNDLPMVEKGETVHDVPHVEEKAPVAAPVAPKGEEKAKVEIPVSKYNYPKGQDPYREPLV